jgi:hypothetical protein
MKLSSIFRRSGPAKPAAAEAPAASGPPARLATLNPDGTVKGFYSSDVHHASTIPTDAVQITEDQYRRWHEGQGANPMRRYRLVGGTLVEHVPELTAAQRAHAALGAGLTVSIGGRRIVVPVDAHARQSMAEGIALLSVAPQRRSLKLKGHAAGEWAELTADQYRAVAGAALAYAAELQAVAHGSPGATMPDNEVEIRGA